jgi:hypothetical protein
MVEIMVEMVENGYNCCRSVRRVHKGRRACSGRRALDRWSSLRLPKLG